MVTPRYDVAAESAPAQLRLLSEQILPNRAQQPGITGVQSCHADKAASSIQTEEK
jgi:hypothetical protein